MALPRLQLPRERINPATAGSASHLGFLPLHAATVSPNTQHRSSDALLSCCCYPKCCRGTLSGKCFEQPCDPGPHPGLEIAITALYRRGKALKAQLPPFYGSQSQNTPPAPLGDEAKLEPYLESIAQLPSLRSLQLRHWTLAPSDAPLLETAVFFFFFWLGCRWPGRSPEDFHYAFEEHWPLTEGSRPRAYLYAQNAEDDSVLELAILLPRSWSVRMALGIDFSRHTMHKLKTVMRPELDVLH